MDFNEMTGVIDSPETPKKNRRFPVGTVLLILALIGIAVGAYFLMVSLLSGGMSSCDGFGIRSTVPFEEMEYVRPDKEAVFKTIDDAVKSVTADEDSYADQVKLIRDYIINDYTIYTMNTLAMIRNSLDTTDEFYMEEMNFFAEFMPLYYQKEEELSVACAQSKHMEDFEEDCYTPGYLEPYKYGGTITDESVELAQHTEELSLDYLTESAIPTVMWNGEETPLYDLIGDPEITGDEYYRLLKVYYDKYNPIFGEMYVDLVKSNMMLAEEYGYDSFIDYAYENSYRDYTPAEAAKFMEDAREYYVPLFQKLNEDGHYDAQYDYAECSEEDLVWLLKSVTRKLGGKISSVYRYMEKYGLYDFSVSDVKEPMSYTSYLYDYDAPFIILDAVGDDTDFIGAVHEFGHFVDNYLNYGRDSGLDCSETASQGMEYLSLSCLDSVLGDDTRELIYTKKLLDSVDVFIYQGYYNALETKVYSLDYEDVTLENINRIAGECAEEFGLKDMEPWEGYYSVSWVDVPHLYDSPLYIISYCVSCDAALQIYEMSVDSPKEAVNTYCDLVDWDWDMTFEENLERVGLESPFAQGRAEKSAKIIESYFYN